MNGKFAAQAAAIQREQWEKYPDIMQYIYGSPPERSAPEKPAQTGHNQTLTAPQKCGIIKMMIRRHVRRWKRKQEGKKMANNSIILRRYTITADFEGYQYHFRFTIDCANYDDTAKGTVKNYLEKIATANNFGAANIIYVSGAEKRGTCTANTLPKIQKHPDCIFHGILPED
jgi:hypothetical protein